jgi:hypothetical protein
MVNFRVVLAEKSLDLPTRAIYKLPVWSVRNVSLTSPTTSARAAARRSKTEIALSRICSGITNHMYANFFGKRKDVSKDTMFRTG